MTPNNIAVYVSLAVCVLLLGFGLAVLVQIARNRIDLTYLLSEGGEGADGAQPKASLSRFQFLIFTFVIAGLYLVLCVESGTFIDVPNGTLALLGISGGGYLVSKGIGGAGGKSDAGGTPATGGGAMPQPAPPVPPAPRPAPVPPKP